MSTKFQRAQPQRIYQLRIELQHIKPPIWRRILVPDNLKLAKLDRVVQAAMGWTNSHLHDWHIEQQRYGIPNEEWGDCVFRPNVTADIGIVTGHFGHRDRPLISAHRDRPFRHRDRPFR